jgi:hypothetical protein
MILNTDVRSVGCLSPDQAAFCLSAMICHAKFEYMTYSNLAAGKISNIGKFKFTYVYSNVDGNFVT